MNNRDILFQIGIRVDDDTLRNLLSPELWPGIKSLLEDDNFWYERSKNAMLFSLRVRLNTDWKTIYYSVVTNSYLNYLPSLEVQLEVNGGLVWEDIWKEKSWIDISCPLVLAYAMTDGGSHIIELPLLLDNSIKKGYTQMLLPILAMSKSEDNMKRRLINGVASWGDSNTMAYVLKNCQFSAAELELLLHCSVYTDNGRVILVVLSKVGEDRAQETFDRAIECGSASIARAIYESDLSIIVDWDTVLIASIRSNRVSLVEYALTHVDPVPNLVQLLRASDVILTQSDVIFDSVMRGSETILHNASSRVSTIGEILAKDSRVKVEDMSIETVRLFLWILDRSLLDKARGYVLAEVACGSRTREHLGRATEKDDIYSLLLAQILIKCPSASELMKWMIDLRNEQLVLAARSAFKDIETNKELIPIRALLLCIVYPTQSLAEVISCLQEEEVDSSSIARAARLVGLYLGESGILSRT